MLLDEDGHVEDLFACWPLFGVNLEERAQNCGKVRRVVRRNFWVNALHDALVETFHILGRKWWVQRNKFVEYATQWPDIRFVVIWFILPDFWTRIVRSTSLCLQNTGLRNFWNIQISKFYHTFLGQEHVGALYISMNNLLIVKRLQTKYHLVEDGPHIIFLCESWGFLGIIDFGLKITVITILHDDA